MRLNAKFIAACFLVLALPAVASATYIAGLTPVGDCNGWWVDATVRFRSTAFEADAILVVQLTDLDMNVLDEQVIETTLTREESSYQTQVYSFAGEWAYYGPAGRYHVVATLTISAERADGTIDEDEMMRRPKFTCGVVSTEAATWSSVKGLYR